MAGIFYLILFYFLGELISYLSAGILPGSIIGMLMLFAALHFNIVKKEQMKGAVTFLLDNMILFFVPVTVGIMTSYKMVGEHLAAILISCAVSTLLVIWVVGALQQYLEKRRKKR